MSFLSAIINIKLDKNLVPRLELSNVLGKLFSAIKQLYESVTYVVKSFAKIENLTVQENWLYQIDPLTNLRLLKVEKDPMALSKTKNILKDLFQTSE